MKNALNWFEIPVTDFDRAVTFYNTVLGIDMRRQEFNGVMNGVLPYDSGDHRGVGGSLIHDPRVKPARDGITVYLNVDGKMDAVLARVANAGGQIALPKTDIGMGHIALIIDSEGNRVGLHSY